MILIHFHHAKHRQYFQPAVLSHLEHYNLEHYDFMNYQHEFIMIY